MENKIFMFEFQADLQTMGVTITEGVLTQPPYQRWDLLGLHDEPQ